MYVPDTLDCDAENVFDLQQKHAFGILVANVKESSAMPIIHCYSDPQATDYGDAQQLYPHLVTHYTQGLSGRQYLKILECDIDYLHFDKNWAKTCEAFLNMVHNKLKDHMGIAPDPSQYPDSGVVGICVFSLFRSHANLAYSSFLLKPPT